MKGASGFLSVLLVLVLILGCNACALGNVNAAAEETTAEELIIGADSTTELFIPLTEKTSKILDFPLSEDHPSPRRRKNVSQ